MIYPLHICLNPNCFKKVVIDHDKGIALTCECESCTDFMAIIDDARSKANGSSTSMTMDVGKSYYRAIKTYSKRSDCDVLRNTSTTFRGAFNTAHNNIKNDIIDDIERNVAALLNGRKRRRDDDEHEHERELDDDVSTWDSDEVLEFSKRQLIYKMNERGLSREDASDLFSCFMNDTSFNERWESRDNYGNDELMN